MKRRALTLLELLAILAIIGVLMALLLPAIQSARDASRRAQCASNMRQVALALHQYEAIHRVLPSPCFRNYSFHVRLLPYLEQKSLYDRFDFSVNALDYRGPLHLVRVPVLECPSDDSRTKLPRLPAETNYHGNRGTGALRYGNNGIFSYGSSLPGYVAYLPWAAVTDGLSQTAMLAEVAASDKSLNRLRVVWPTPAFAGRDQLDDFAEACRAAPTAATSKSKKYRPRPIQRGRPWTTCDVITVLYDHVLAPNGPSCANGGDFVMGAFTSSSFHRQGVNVAMADGSVQAVGDSIEITVWRALGSRAGDP